MKQYNLSPESIASEGAFLVNVSGWILVHVAQDEPPSIDLLYLICHAL